MARLLIPLGLAAALGVDAAVDRTQAAVAAAAPPMPAREIVPPPDALTSTWFCPLVGLRPIAESLGDITTMVLLTNMTDEPSQASVEFRGRTLGNVVANIEIAPRRTMAVRTADYVSDEVVGALVESSAGGLAVTRRFVSSLGVDETRCSSLLAADWHMPTGDTQVDALTAVAVMNPLPRDAIVDITFVSEAESGPVVAPELTGVVVPKSSTAVIDLGEHARRRDIVATSVRARTGRIAVDAVAAYDGSFGRRGFAVELASAAVGGRWLVPAAGFDDHTTLSVRVFNPSDDIAAVTVSVDAAGSSDGSLLYAFGPQKSLAVGPRAVEELAVEAPSEQPPDNVLVADPGVPLGLSIVSQNGVPLVVWAEALVGDSTSPRTGIRIEEDAASAAGEEAAPEAAAQAGTEEQTADREAAQNEAAQDEAAAGDGVDPPDGRSAAHVRSPVLASQSGLSVVPGIAQTSDRWLVVVARQPRSEVFLTVMADPLASAAGGTQSENRGASSAAADRRVVVQDLSGRALAVIEVPQSGVVTHSLASGTARLLVSDAPFAALVWQARIDGAGLSVALPTPW